MDERQATFVALQVFSLVILGATVYALWRAVSVWRSVRYKDGGDLAVVIVGVLGAFVVAQTMSIFNVFGLMSSGESGFHPLVRLAQQGSLAIAAIWASIRLSRIS